MCVGCGQCTTKCQFDAIKLVKVYNEEGVTFKKLKPVIVKHILKRKIKMTFNKIKDKFKLRRS